MIYRLILLIGLCLPTFLIGQGIKVGVRSGLDITSLNGPKEKHESFTTNTGFHFGVNVSLPLSDILSIRGEIGYQQKGFTKRYKGQGYYPIVKDSELQFVDSNIDYLLNVSNAYISLPITLQIQPARQIEFTFGVNVSFLINPIGSGRVDVVSTSDPERLFFRQNLSYRYFQDEAGKTATSEYNPQVYVGEDVVTVPGALGAYYFADASDSKPRAINWLDLSAVAGFNFFINKSLYLGARAEYGLIDVTRTKYDTSLETTNGEEFQYNDNKDFNIGLQLSLGFRF